LDCVLFVRGAKQHRIVANSEFWPARGVYSSIIPPPPTPGGGGKGSKGLRAREENQRRVEKMERQREKKRKISVGNS
jgi:hypothetical protein